MIIASVMLCIVVAVVAATVVVAVVSGRCRLWAVSNSKQQWQ